MIDPASIQKVKDTAAIADIVGLSVKLKKDGGGFVGLCPFHNEKTPSFKVSPGKNIFKCFGCGATGDAIEFVVRHDKVDYIAAVRKIAEHYRITLDEVQDTPKTFARPTAQTNPILSKNAVDYFISRAISMDTLLAMKVTSSTHWMPKAKTEVEVINFNYYRGGQLINVKYRTIAEKDFMLHKDAELIFYNLDSANGKEFVIITEGEVDCLSVVQSGYTSVISVPNGAAKGNLKLDYFGSAYDLFSAIGKVILFTDSDANGVLLRNELARRIGFEKCWVANIPSDCKDANDILKKYGVDGVKAAIKTAQQMPIEGVFSMNDFYNEVKDFYVNGYPGGIKIGVPELDEYLSFMFGQITIITGIPGSGKSEFLDFICTELAKVHGWVFAVCSAENQPVSLHMSKIMEKYSRRSFAPRYNERDRISPQEFEQASAFVDQRFIFLDIDTVEMTLDGILAKASELIARKGVNALIIDPWNYIEHKYSNGQSETQYASEALTKLKWFAKRKQIHIFMVAHPTKIPKINGKYDVPTLYHISGSAHFFNKTDNGICVYRDFSTNNVEIYVQKVRYSWLGKIGVVELGYDTNRRQYTYPSLSESDVKPIPDSYRDPSQPNEPKYDDPRAGIGYQSGEKVDETFWNS